MERLQVRCYIFTSDLLQKTDYCGLVSGEKTDQSQVFDVFYGSLKTAPMIKECPVNLECRLIQAVSLSTNTLFVGEIIGAYADGRVLKDGKSDKKLEKAYLTFHGARMYADAARLKVYKKTGEFPDVTKSKGLESLKSVLEENAKFPTTKSELTEKQGWKVFDLTGTEHVHASQTEADHSFIARSRLGPGLARSTSETPILPLCAGKSNTGHFFLFFASRI